MADSTVVRIPQSLESELKEMDKTPLNQSPLVGTPPPTRSQRQSSMVIDKTLSSTANLVKLLPSGTVLAFQALSPAFSNRGTCHPSNKYLTSALLILCALSCIFFSFTDSLIGRDGNLYFGIATFKSFYVFNYDGTDEDRIKIFKDLRRFKIRILDYVHAVFSILLFLTLSLSDSGVQACFFPNTGQNTKQLLVNLPLGAGFLSSLVFMIFPTSRKGIGYSDMSPHAQ